MTHCERGSIVQKHVNVVVITLVIFVVFLSGIVVAFSAQKAFARSQDTTLVYACVNTHGGMIRVANATTVCGKGEILLSWDPQALVGAGGGNFGLGYSCTQCALYIFASKFAGKDFSNAQIVSGDFYGADIHGVSFKGSYLQSTDFTNANLIGADLSNLIDAEPRATVPYSNNGYFKGVHIVFTSANATNVNFSNDIFQTTDFSSANLTGANFSNVQLVDLGGIFSGNNFSQANLKGAIFTNTMINKANFTGATNMATVNITGVTWINTTCPDGSNSDNDGQTCVGHF